MINDYPCGAVDVGFVFKPLAVAHLGTEPQKEQAASERRIIAQELADESQRGTSVRISQLIDFFLYTIGFSCSVQFCQSLRSFRVPAVYLTSAFLWFFSILLFRRINNFRSLETLCDVLNKTNTLFPGTQLRVRYSVTPSHPEAKSGHLPD
jgi:hypothetical protein